MEKVLKNKNKNNELNEGQKCRYVVHEMLNPLSIINNCTELMLHKLDDIGKNYDSDNSGGSDNDNNSSIDNLSDIDRNQMIVLLSMIKNQINKCTEVSKSIIGGNCDNTVINVNNMLIEYINTFKINNPSVNMLFKSNISNSYHFRSNNSKAYLKIIMDNMINNVLKYNNSVYIKINKLKDSRIEMIIGDNDNNNNDTKAVSPINERKTSHFTGLEIIEKFCNILGIYWSLIQNEQMKYVYRLVFSL